MKPKPCDTCPCLELKNGVAFCYWYQGFVADRDGCSNHFTIKPRLTQQEVITIESVKSVPLRRNIELKEIL